MVKPNTDNHIKSFIKMILDTSGLDLIPYALGWSKFDSKLPFEVKNIKEKISNLDIDKIDDALVHSKGLLDEESERGKIIENKAYNLIGVTSISAAFITGISDLLPEKTELFVSFLFMSLYILIVIALTLTILLASKAVLVGVHTGANIEDIFNMSNESLEETKKERLYSYLYAYAKNTQMHNIKASSLIGSQLWFRNALVLFLIFALALASTFFNFANNTSLLLTPTSLPGPTQLLTPTQTFAPIATYTSSATLQPSLTPTLFLLPSSPPTIISVLTATPTLVVIATPTK